MNSYNPMKNDFNQRADADKIDQLFKDRFTHFQAPPPHSKWSRFKIQHGARKYLPFLLPIAACLLIAPLLLWLRHLPTPPSTSLAITPIEDCQAFPTLATDELPIPTNPPIALSPNKPTLQLLPNHPSLDNLLSSILQEDHFKALDSSTIHKALSPSNPPSYESASAQANPPAEEEIELKIMIPLKVVEEDEIEALLEVYDRLNGQINQ